MIVYNYHKALEAQFNFAETHSTYTGIEFTYSYYCELCKKFRNRTMEDIEYYDWEVCMVKYDRNRK